MAWGWKGLREGDRLEEGAKAGLPLHPTIEQVQTELKERKKGKNLRALEPAGAYSTSKKALVLDMIADDAKDR